MSSCTNPPDDDHGVDEDGVFAVGAKEAAESEEGPPDQEQG